MEGEGHSSGRAPPYSQRERLHKCLLDAEVSLRRALQADPNTILEAKAWLTATIAELGPVPPATARSSFLPALHERHRAGAEAAAAVAPSTTGLPPSAQRQLLQLLCEEAATEVGQLLAGFPDLLQDLFRSSDRHIAAWFGGFSMGGIQHFTPGALALANFSLTHREDVWRHLSWSGKHPQAPVSVAAKTHYFCELDVVRTVRRLLAACPEFWSSHELRKSLRGGTFLALDYGFMVEELSTMLEGGRSSRHRVLDLLDALVTSAPWPLLASRLLPLLDEPQLLRVVRAVSTGLFGADSSRNLRRWAHAADATGGVSGAAVGGASMAPLVFSGVRFEQLLEAMMVNALACRGAQMLLVLQQQDEDAEPHVHALAQAAGVLHGPDSDGQAHSAMHDALRALDTVQGRLLLLLDAWLLSLHWVQRLQLEPQLSLAPLLTQIGATWQRQAEPLLPAGGDADRRGGSTTARDASSAGHVRKRSKHRDASQPSGKKKKKKRGSSKRSKKRRRLSGDDSGSDVSDVSSSSDSLLDPKAYSSAATEGIRLGGGSGHTAPAARPADGAGDTASAQWNVQLPGGAGGFQGTARHVVHVVSCYLLQQWVRQLLQQAHSQDHELRW